MALFSKYSSIVRPWNGLKHDAELFRPTEHKSVLIFRRMGIIIAFKNMIIQPQDICGHIVIVDWWFWKLSRTLHIAVSENQRVIEH